MYALAKCFLFAFHFILDYVGDFCSSQIEAATWGILYKKKCSFYRTPLGDCFFTGLFYTNFVQDKKYDKFLISGQFFYLNHFMPLVSLSTTPWKHQMFSDVFRAYRKTIVCESLKSVCFSKIFWGKKVIFCCVYIYRCFYKYFTMH